MSQLLHSLTRAACRSSSSICGAHLAAPLPPCPTNNHWSHIFPQTYYLDSLASLLVPSTYDQACLPATRWHAAAQSYPAAFLVQRRATPRSPVQPLRQPGWSGNDHDIYVDWLWHSCLGVSTTAHASCAAPCSTLACRSALAVLGVIVLGVIESQSYQQQRCSKVITVSCTCC